MMSQKKSQRATLQEESNSKHKTSWTNPKKPQFHNEKIMSIATCLM
jgi:hypothetical protein